MDVVSKAASKAGSNAGSKHSRQPSQLSSEEDDDSPVRMTSKRRRVNRPVFSSDGERNLTPAPPTSPAQSQSEDGLIIKDREEPTGGFEDLDDEGNGIIDPDR